MTYESIMADLKAKKYSPIYFLGGEEPFYIDQIVKYIEHHVLEESERSFNQTIFYGRDVDVISLIAEAKKFPMMAPYNVVIVKEAQHLKKMDALLAYAENPQPTTIFVIAQKYKKVDKRTKFYKHVSKNFVFFESKKLYDNQVPTWIEQDLRRQGFKVSPKAAALLAEHLGTDLTKIHNEIHKLKLVVPVGGEITGEVIEKNIGISKDYNIFELTKALTHKDIKKSMEIAFHFNRNPKEYPLVMTIATIFSFFSKVLLVHGLGNIDERSLAGELKVSPYFVRDYIAAARMYPAPKTVRIIGYLREADRKSKGLDNATISDGDLLRELLFKILH